MPHRVRDTRSPPSASSYAGSTRASIDLHKKRFSNLMDCWIKSGNDAVFVEARVPAYHGAEETNHAPPRNPSRRNSRRRTERVGNHANRIVTAALRAAKPHFANHPGQARHHRRHGASSRPLAPNQRAILAQSAIG